MKACVLVSNGQLEIQDIPLQEVTGWYKIKIAYAGICGSDLGRGFRNGAYHYPLVMGHEFSGEVASCPGGQSMFAEGDQVAVYPLLPCGKCAPCQDGHPELCTSYDYFGSRRDGGFAEYVYVPEKNLLRLPQSVRLKEAALCEPAAVAHHSIWGHPVRRGSGALVLGAGPVGLLAAQWLRIRGCSTIAVADIVPQKLDFARTLGFEGIDSRTLESGDRLFENVVEACGAGTTRTLALRCCRRLGHIFLIGNPADDWRLEKKDYSSILRKEITLGGSWNSNPQADWTAVLEHAGKDLDLKALITDCLPLERAPELFHQVLTDGEFHCKALIHCAK